MKILVIDDEPTIARYIKKGLELKNYIVDICSDGQAGYDLASESSYQLIILDRMLPNLSGDVIAQRLRQEGYSAPILMLTARDQVSDVIEGLNAGADDYLSKPFSFSELVARIQALSRRMPIFQSNQITIRDLTIETDTARVKRGGSNIVLTKKEYALLEFLAKHPGQVFNSQRLTELVWEYDSDVLPNTAQVYIGYLRKKIDRPFSHRPKLIHTVRGFGYKLE